MADYSSMTEEELYTERGLIDTELANRYILASAPAQMAALNMSYLTAEGTVEGEAWEQPEGSHDAYPLDWVVTHNGGSWRSLIAGNVWEPGVSGWAVEGGGEWPMWVQPTGAHDDYDQGAKVSHVDKHWVSDVDGNVWEPGVFGWIEEVA